MPNILIVEDDLSTIDCLTDLLETEGFQVMTATDGKIAQDIVARQKIDLVVCELILPQVNGYELLSRLRNNKVTEDIPFIVLADNSKIADINFAQEMGVDDYLIKPYLNHELVVSIRAQLEKKQFLEQCYQATMPDSTTMPTTLAPPASLDREDTGILDDDAENQLSDPLILIERLNKIVSEYISERTKSLSAHRSNTSSIAVCCLRLNGMEKTAVNSQKQSNEITKAVSQRLLNSIGHQANVTRLHNGDFAIVMPYVKNLQQAAEIIRTGQKFLSEPLMLGSSIINLESYVGISFYPDRTQDIKVLLELAQQLADKAQKNREDYYEVYAPNAFPVSEFTSLVLVETLEDIWSKNQLTTSYQPQIDLLTGEVLGYQALLCWQHPQQGNISAENLLRIAKDAGLSEPIETQFMFDECKRLKKLHQQGFNQLKLAINISASQLHRHDFIATVKQILTEVKLNPQFLIVELTENTLLKNPKKSIAHLSELKSWGVGVTLASLSKYYRSLNHLQRFPLTMLKVDLGYLDSLLSTSDARIAFRYITRAARQFNLQLIVAGVETKHQLNFLRQHPWGMVQGNYLTPLLTIDELEYLLSAKSEWLTILFSQSLI